MLLLAAARLSSSLLCSVPKLLQHCRWQPLVCFSRQLCDCWRIKRCAEPTMLHTVCMFAGSRLCARLQLRPQLLL